LRFVILDANETNNMTLGNSDINVCVMIFEILYVKILSMRQSGFRACLARFYNSGANDK